MATIKSELDYIQEARTLLATALINKFGVQELDILNADKTIKSRGLYAVKTEDGSKDYLKRLHDWAVLVNATNVHTDGRLSFSADGDGNSSSKGGYFNGSQDITISYNDIGAVSINDMPYIKNFFVEGTQKSATNLWTGTIPDLSALYDGLTIRYYLPYAGNNSGATLNINNLGAYPIYRYGRTTQITTHFAAGSVITLTFRTSYKVSENTYTNAWIVDAYYDSNDGHMYIREHNYRPYVATDKTLNKYRICFITKDGTLLPVNNDTIENSADTTSRSITQDPFILYSGIYYYNSTAQVTAGKQVASGVLYSHFGIVDLRYSFNTALTLTAYKDVFLVCIPQANGTFTLHSTTPITQTLPTSENNLVYVRIGWTINKYQITFTGFKSILWFKNGKIQKYLDYSEYAKYDKNGNDITTKYVTLDTTLTIIESKIFDNSIIMGTNHYIYGKQESLGALVYFDGSRTIVGSAGETTTGNTRIRTSSDGKYEAYYNNNIKYFLHTGNYTNYTYSSTTSRDKNTVLAAPNGSNGVASFRSLVSADIPELSSDKITKLTGYSLSDTSLLKTSDTLNAALKKLDDNFKAYLPRTGGSMITNESATNDTLKYAKIKWGESYIGAGANDAANNYLTNPDKLNNLVIGSWYGISFTTSEPNSTYYNKNAVSINCRNGNTHIGGILRTKGDIINDSGNVNIGSCLLHYDNDYKCLKFIFN